MQAHKHEYKRIYIFNAPPRITSYMYARISSAGLSAALLELIMVSFYANIQLYNIRTMSAE